MTWLADWAAPPGWRRGRLKDCIRVTNGYPFDSSAFEDAGHKGVPLVRIRDLTAGRSATVVTGGVPSESFISDGDLIVGMDGDFLSRRWTGGRAALNQRLCKVDAVGDMDLRYLDYLLPMPLRYINDLTYATTVKHLSAGDIGEQPTPLPPIEEQRRIADFLDTETARIDALIAKRHRQIELLVQRRELSTRVAVWGGSLERDGAQRLPTSEGEWPWLRLKRFAREVDDRSADGVGELLSVSHLTGVSARSESVTMTMAETLEGYKACRRGDLVVNTLWAWMGALGVSPTAGLVSPAYGVYRFDTDQVVPEFFERLFRTEDWIAEMTAYSRGVWTSRLRLYPEDLLRLRAPCPPRSTQQAIVDEIDRRFSGDAALVDALTRQIGLLRERRQGLITAAVRGEISVP